MNSKRPLSPHIQIYKPQISSFTSILHRATGIFLYFGVVAIFWLIVYYTYKVEVMSENGVEETACDCRWVWYALYLLAGGWAFSLYYHLLNGIRHLFWDIGKGFEKTTATRNGIIVIMLSLLMTAASICYTIYFLS
ncbi:MAG: succinate dehydrogenase [Rickettsiaceae bacterium]|jgi:succinate dehydrogenase / fumarate reductase cytochrome b subunit|nr:succinate dehydrogenase [Rickettsiaceae bacterium]